MCSREEIVIFFDTLRRYSVRGASFLEGKGIASEFNTKPKEVRREEGRKLCEDG